MSKCANAANFGRLLRAHLLELEKNKNSPMTNIVCTFNICKSKIKIKKIQFYPMSGCYIFWAHCVIWTWSSGFMTFPYIYKQILKLWEKKLVTWKVQSHIFGDLMWNEPCVRNKGPRRGVLKKCWCFQMGDLEDWVTFYVMDDVFLP